MTWTKLILYRCLSFGGFCISISDLNEIKVMLETKSTITLIRLDFKELMVAMIWASKKEQPGGWTRYFLSSINGLELGEVWVME